MNRLMTSFSLPTAGLFLLLAGCGPTENPEKETDLTHEPIQIITTTGMVADLVRSIGGEHVAVRNLIGEGIDPHLYKPNRDDVAELMDAKMVFYNGLMLEGRMTQALEKVASTKPVVAVAEEIPRELLIFPSDAGNHPDPHVWLDPELWSRCTDSVVTALSKVRPMHAAEFKANSVVFIDKAMKLGEYGQECIGSIPKGVRMLVTSHDAFNYFGRAFDIEVLGVQGISTESEAGLADIEKLVALLVERRVPAVFVESSVPARSVEALVEGAAARGVTITIGGELYTDAMGTPGTYEGTWPGMLDHDVTTVTRALGGTSPTGGISGRLSEHSGKEGTP